MADAIVTALMKQLISVAFEEGRQQVKLVAGVQKEVSKLESNLLAIQTVLDNAEQRQVKEKTVGLWLDRLKYAAYDMEDVLDEWNTARLKLQIEGVGDDDDESAVVPRDQKKKKKVCSCLPTSYFGFKHVFLRRDIALKIKDINKKLNDIARQRDMFNLDVNLNKGTTEEPKQVGTISSIDESQISGRVMEKIALISMLVGTSSVEPNGLHIISLVGMGGIGKTTLAQLAYNDDEVKRNFEKRIWVCVSNPFDELRIARAIIEALEGSITNLQEFQSLTQHIEELIIEKKFFLVLDDVWNEKYHRFEKLYNCLRNGSQGSKILITTRKEIVARTMGSTSRDIISIKELPEKECWSLFKRLAFFGRSGEECEKLEEIGRLIVDKCKGLPLAVKTIGSLLRSKNTQEWQTVLNSEMWELEELEQDILAPLLLSYNDLPSMVKRCFQYCAIFPKDHQINKDKLIKLWMAQDYLSVKGNQEMEISGQTYFDILATRSFFQEFKKDEDDSNVIISCKMHDIVHDFAQYVCKQECVIIEVNNDDESFEKTYGEKVRHSMLTLSRGIPFPISVYRANKLRSLIIDCEGVDYLQLFSALTCLRVLDINEGWKSLIEEVPKEIGKLIHLRYLNLSTLKIKKLPETLCELYNLQTLDITSCNSLEELPKGIGKLINMRYLLNEWTTSLKYMSAGIARLTSLRTLKKLVLVGDGGEDDSKMCTLESLKDLNLLQECLIEGLGYVRDLGEVKKSQLEKKRNLLVLCLDFGQANYFDYEQEEGQRTNEEDEKILKALELPVSLKKLDLKNYIGNTIFPNCLMSLTKLRELNLWNCFNCEHLPPLGKLPSLENLLIRGLDSVKRVGNEFLGILESNHHGSSSSSSSSSSSFVIAFPKLKTLSIEFMYELEEWEYRNITEKGNITIMPRLSSLVLWQCRKLKTLPDQLLQKTSLQNLEVFDCPVRKLLKDRAKISHIPKVRIS